MSIPVNEQKWSCRSGLVVVAFLFTGLLAAACGGKSSGPGVAGLGGSTDRLLAYAGCMRTHGEPNMPEPSIQGNTVHLSASPGSGFDPNSPQFTAADNACKHLLVGTGGAPPGNVITPADQADYLKAAACMRSHGVPNFPDPVFENNNVTFNAPGTSIDTNSSQYKSALVTCEKLIPAGLPYSSPGGS